MTSAETARPSDSAIRSFVGFAGYASLGSFALLAEDASVSPDIVTRLRLSRMAAAELAELDFLEDLIIRHADDPGAVMVEFAPILKDFMVRAEPRDWWERIMRTYVGFNLLEDLLHELADGLPGDLTERVREAAGVPGHTDFVAEALQPVLAEDEKLASRLALWGRRVVGEGIMLVRRLFAEHPELAELIPGDGDSAAREAALLARLQANHARRLGRLKLTS
ncbi:MAG: ferritin-like fold-containing protein [bacterium]|nr:ferritin-like fold-containing protein [bacterium]